MSLPRIGYLLPSFDMIVSELLVYSYGKDCRRDCKEDMISLLHVLHI
jgi:hypothetical protein